MAFHGINIDRGIELPGTEEARRAEEVAGAVRGRAVRAEQAAAHPVILALLVLCPILHLHLLLLRPVHVMDAHQQAVVHDFQLGQKLGEGEEGEEGVTQDIPVASGRGEKHVPFKPVLRL